VIVLFQKKKVQTSDSLDTQEDPIEDWDNDSSEERSQSAKDDSRKCKKRKLPMSRSQADDFSERSESTKDNSRKRKKGHRDDFSEENIKVIPKRFACIY